MYSAGPVAVGTDRAIGKLTVDGDIYTTGKLITPSDIRLKENITEREAREALDNLCKLRIVDYFYKPEVAEKWGLTEEQRKRTGVIAQELAAVLPDAVKDIGDYLTVNESRVFYETVLATQELCRLTGDLDQKIDDKVEEISQRLAKYAARKKMLSSMASNLDSKDKKSIVSQSHLSLISSVSQYKEKRRSRRASSQQQQGLCGSRWAQGTIILLVGIMAFCLLTMSGLYVLDWHNRNYGYHHVYHGSQSAEPPANMVLSPNRGVPHWQPDAPPVMPNCVSLQCKNYCCPDGEEEPDSEEFNGENSFEPVSRSTFTKREFGTGVSIQLPEYKMDIDSRYCVEKSCNKKLRVFNLFIPISKYYPNLPLEVLIKTPHTKSVSNCGYVSYFANKQCSDRKKSTMDDTIYPASSQIMENLFELDVGDYIQSAYRFRVSYIAEACFAHESNGGTYEEYNLFFYRQCNTNNNSTTF
ncbi:unnamed protein product [Caenorhabditis angaria]|uniref:Peptidase S74 domain-containing protein n=1 Tax=Caenorhabditis angaria TaxID=860376 RepID=A0A9P1J4R4_9PELO|nr:unnamed protein product [Caenorhabditis angaria]